MWYETFYYFHFSYKVSFRKPIQDGDSKTLIWFFSFLSLISIPVIFETDRLINRHGMKSTHWMHMLLLESNVIKRVDFLRLITCLKLMLWMLSQTCLQLIFTFNSWYVPQSTLILSIHLKLFTFIKKNMLLPKSIDRIDIMKWMFIWNTCMKNESVYWKTINIIHCMSHLYHIYSFQSLKYGSNKFDSLKESVIYHYVMCETSSLKHDTNI